MIAVFWAYDGWYQLTFTAGELKRPERSLPVGLVAGTASVVVLYALVNLVYLRALPLEAIAATERVGEAAATVLAGATGARLISAAILVSIFGALSAAILACSRIYQPLAADGLFFPSLAAVHDRWRTPARSLLAQAGWSIVLVFSGNYEQLYTYVVFALVLFHAATGAAVFVLRRARPAADRPYRTWGYPFVPALFVAFSLALAANTLAEKPRESLVGLALVACGLPSYAFWRRRDGPGAGAGGG
jgi:APA family basic amino acid/polyamine antiporter